MKRADHQLVQQVIDGDLSPEEFDAFQKRLRNEPELEQLYAGYSLLHHSLSEEFEHSSAPAAAESPPGRRGLRIGAWLAVATLMVLAAVLWWHPPWLDRSHHENVAVASFSVDAVWAIHGSSRNLGSATGIAPDGTLKLLQGRAAITLEPSVSAVIEGPAALRFISANRLRIEYGRARFQLSGNPNGLQVSTANTLVTKPGRNFGVNAVAGGVDEVHAFEGDTSLAATGGNQSHSLHPGSAATIGSDGGIQPGEFKPELFPSHLGRFRSILSGPFERSKWRIEYGTPVISDHRIDGGNYAIFHRLDQPQPADTGSVFLATIEAKNPENGSFHTDGWAGMSFFANGKEVLFFGDSFGTTRTWSLDVKQNAPVIVPEQPLTGPGKVTLRYDSRTGDVTLHQGTTPLGPAICSGKIPAGIRFDDIRLAASAGAALAVTNLEIRTSEDP